MWLCQFSKHRKQLSDTLARVLGLKFPQMSKCYINHHLQVTARIRKPENGLYTGVIDAVDTSDNTYRITFDRHGIGTHSIPDYEVLVSSTPTPLCPQLS